ncbi:MAG: hypothetical protein Q9227_008516 [Pyrenula ochraceoflavens]
MNDGRKIAFMEARTGWNVLTAWNRRCNQASNIETLCLGIMCTLLAKIPENEALSIMFLEKATRLVIPIVGYENQLWCSTVHDYGWKLEKAGRHQEIDDLLQEIMPRVNSDNFYSVVKSVDLWQHSLLKRGLMDQVERLLNKYVEEFKNTTQEDRVYWEFSNDPILDALEFLVVFFRDCKKNDAKMQSTLDEYETYFDRVYHHPVQKTFLGFGIGQFGMSFARSRVEFMPKDRDNERFSF